jgi:transcriptional regulator with XRE-family HTH domain
METIGSRICLYRHSCSWTQGRLASVTGIRQSVLSTIENDRLSPKWDLIVAISKALNVPVRQLLPLEETDISGEQLLVKEENIYLRDLLAAKEELLKEKDRVIALLENEGRHTVPLQEVK